MQLLETKKKVIFVCVCDFGRQSGENDAQCYLHVAKIRASRAYMCVNTLITRESREIEPKKEDGRVRRPNMQRVRELVTPPLLLVGYLAGFKSLENKRMKWVVMEM